MMMPVRRTGIGRLGDQSLTDIISQAAQAQGVPVALALAQAQRESGMNPNAVGAAGEIGLFQLSPQFYGGQGDLTDPTINANVALAKMSQLFSKYGNWTDALDAYNEGEGAFDQGHRYGSGYAASILASAGMSVTGGTTTPPVTTAPGPPALPAAPAPTPPAAPGTTDLATIALVAVAGIFALEVLS